MSRALLPVADALRQVLAVAAALAAENVGIADAAGRVLAQSVRARWDLPAANLSVMDGYAVRSQDVPAPGAVLKRTSESAAGHPSEVPVAPGEAARISTGAAMPPGADAVVPQEDTSLRATEITINTGPISAGRFVRPAGSEVRNGSVLLEAGSLLQPGDLALIAAAGHATVPVHRRPRVAIVSTGDELVPIGSTPRAGQIISTNGMMLTAAARRAGAEIATVTEAGDRHELLRSALELARGDVDIVLTSGGVSVGDHDLVLDVLAELGCAPQFHGIALRPGKPTAFGRLDDALWFGLPGNPASTLVVFALLVRPALRRLLGVRGAGWTTRPVTVASDADGAGRRAHFARARLNADGTVATILPSQSSGDLRSIADFDALVEIPAGTTKLSAGDPATAIIIDPWWTERRS